MILTHQHNMICKNEVSPMYTHLVLLFLSRLLLLSVTVLYLGLIGYFNYQRAVKKGHELMDLMTSDFTKG